MQTINKKCFVLTCYYLNCYLSINIGEKSLALEKADLLVFALRDLFWS